jgi:hypothetical protein
MSQKWKTLENETIAHDHGEPFEKKYNKSTETYDNVKPVATVIPISGKFQGQEIPVSKFQAKRLVKMRKAVNTDSEYKSFRKKEEKEGRETKELKLLLKTK